MKNICKKQKGSVAIEYVSLLAGIAFGLFVVITAFGNEVKDALNYVASQITTVQDMSQ